MTKRYVSVDDVVVSASNFLFDDVTGLNQVVQNSRGCPCGDANLGRYLVNGQIGALTNRDQHVSVVGEKSPVGHYFFSPFVTWKLAKMEPAKITTITISETVVGIFTMSCSPILIPTQISTRARPNFR